MTAWLSLRAMLHLLVCRISLPACLPACLMRGQHVAASASGLEGGAGTAWLQQHAVIRNSAACSAAGALEYVQASATGLLAPCRRCRCATLRIPFACLRPPRQLPASYRQPAATQAGCQHGCSPRYTCCKCRVTCCTMNDPLLYASRSHHPNLASSPPPYSQLPHPINLPSSPPPAYSLQAPPPPPPSKLPGTATSSPVPPHLPCPCTSAPQQPAPPRCAPHPSALPLPLQQPHPAPSTPLQVRECQRSPA